MTKTCFSAVIWSLGLCGAFAQNAASPAFEVASIRPFPSLPDDPLTAAIAQKNYGVKLSGSQVRIRYSLAQLIAYAYDVHEGRMRGLPDWAAKSYFEIQALIPDQVPATQLPEMVRTLLQDRFGLVTHSANVPQPGFALMVGKGPLKLHEARDIDPSACGSWLATQTSQGEGQRCSSAQQVGSRRVGTSFLTGGWLGPVRTTMSKSTDGDSDTIQTTEYYRITMSRFAERLSATCTAMGDCVGGPVVDKTGIDGERDLVFERICSADSCENDSSIVQKLGLRLERTTVQVRYLVIDQVNREPTGN